MWVAENTRAGKSTSVLFSSKMRADSHWVHVTDMKETEDTAAKIMRPSKSSSITGSVVDQWWSGEANPWWMSVKLQGARLWAQVLLKVSSDSLVRNIHMDVLPLNYPISVCQIYIYMSVWERECVCICTCVNMLFPVTIQPFHVSSDPGENTTVQTVSADKKHQILAHSAVPCRFLIEKENYSLSSQQICYFYKTVLLIAIAYVSVMFYCVSK